MSAPSYLPLAVAALAAVGWLYVLAPFAGETPAASDDAEALRRQIRRLEAARRALMEDLAEGKIEADEAESEIARIEAEEAACLARLSRLRT